MGADPTASWGGTAARVTMVSSERLYVDPRTYDGGRGNLLPVCSRRLQTVGDGAVAVKNPKRE